jgi:hypothetical protein
MQKLGLELLFHIVGIGSASGLFFNGSSLFLISDNSNMLYEYGITTQKLEKLPLTAKDYTGPMENVPKKDKVDFESITTKGDELYLFGSGSGENRNKVFRFNTKTKEAATPIDISEVYLAMQSFAQIDEENFNIEAAINDGDTWYVFQRGNGPKGENGIFTLTGDFNDLTFQILYNKIKLPKIKGARATFTDAVKVGNKLYFIAAAEKSNSTYLDGEVAGTLVGRIDIETVKVDFTEIISAKNKFEGITVYKDNGNTLEFLLCEDTDSDATESDIYKLTLKK